MITLTVKPLHRCANRSCLDEIPPGSALCSDCFRELPYPVARTLVAKSQRGSLDVGYHLAIRNARTFLESLSPDPQAA